MAGLDLLWAGEEWRKALCLEGYLGSEIPWTRLMDLERGVLGRGRSLRCFRFLAGATEYGGAPRAQGETILFGRAGMSYVSVVMGLRC